MAAIFVKCYGQTQARIKKQTQEYKNTHQKHVAKKLA